MTKTRRTVEVSMKPGDVRKIGKEKRNNFRGVQRKVHPEAFLRQSFTHSAVIRSLGS